MKDDLISRQTEIDAIVNTVSEIGLHDNSEVARYGATFRQHEIIDIIEGIPSAQPSLLDALEIIDQFLHSCRDSLTCEIVTPNGMKLHTDWGYFSEGIDELRRYAEGEKDD